MSKPRCSVLINNYNYGSFVRRAVESALAQDFDQFEVIVVDDGSLDDSRAVLEPYLNRARIIHQSNRGQAEAINAAVRASSGEFLCFLDADDWWEREKLSAVVASFDAAPHTVLTYHRLQPVSANESFILRPLPRSLCSGDLSHRMGRTAGWWPFPMTSAIAVRRSAWDEVGEIPSQFRISADAWLVGAYPFIGRVSALPQAHGFYRIHNNTWYRLVDDPPMLRKRMTHWRATVEATNRFLRTKGLTARLKLCDHLPYQLASAQLTGVSAIRRIGLARQALRFAGEPNPLRRMRDILRTVPFLPGPCGPIGAEDGLK